MSDSEDGILDVVVEGRDAEPKYDMAKLKMLRDSARFIRNVEKTYKQHMAHEKWKKLNMLAKILESNMTPAQFFTQFPDNKIRKIEAVIAKLKAKFKTLWNPTDVIVINDGEPSTSTAAAANRQQTEERASTSASTAKTKANTSASNMTNAVNGTAKKALDKVKQTDAKNNASPKTLPAVKQSGVVRKSNPAAPAAAATKAAKEIVQKTTATTTPNATTAKATTPKANFTVNSKPAASTKAATSTNASTKKVTTKLVVESPKADFERRAKPNTLRLDLTSSTSSLDFERRDAASSSIGTRRQDYVRVMSNSKSPVRTQSPVGVSSPSAVKDPVVFSRRSRFAPLQPTPPPAPPTAAPPAPPATPPTVSSDFERRCNPSPPPAVTTDCLSDEVRLKSPSFQEARKKLAALSSTTNDNNTASKVTTTVTSTFHTSPLASNCNDPRGRNSSYLNSTLSPPKPGQTIVGLQAQAPPSPVPPPPNINGCGNGNNTTWSPNNIPVKEFQRAQSIPAATSPNNNNNNHNLNLNLSLNKSRGLPSNRNLVSGSPNMETPPFERGCFPNSNSKNVNGKEPPRRFNNMSGGSELRDPRCGGGNWCNNNGPPNRSSQQQQQASYSGQGRGRGAPYNNGYNEDWQTSNSNFGYNNKNGSNNNNNNQMSWNANNSNNHFDKNVNKSNANFGFRAAYSRERGPTGNATATGNNNHNNNNNNPHASGNNNINSPVNNEPRTYREYLLAKEKRQKEAAEKQRKLDEAEKQRKLEAAEKQSQLDVDAVTNEVVASIEKVQTDNVQLDTSYRNLQLTGGNKKIDFKIPKKASLEKPKAAETVTKEKSDKTNKSDDVVVVVETWDKEQSSGNNKEKGELKRDANKSHKSGGKVIKASKVHKSDKVDKAEKVSRTDKTDKVNKSDRADKVDGADKVKHSDKRDDSPKPKNKSEKMHDKEKITETDMDKDKRANKKDKIGADKPKEIESKDNVENEPPTLVDNTANASKLADRLSEVETEDSDQLSPRRSRSSSKAKLKEKSVEKKAVEKEEEHEQKDEKEEQVEKFEQIVNMEVDTNVNNLLDEKPKEQLPKLPKLKVVLGPNAHAMVVIPSDAVSSKSDTKETESEAESPPRPPRRIMQRRKSMMPVSSKPLVDKLELFGGSSLDYEDLVEHKREQERQEKQQARVTEPETTQEKRINKNLAVMFEKSNDNCSISTHNILAGKRRSRLNGLTLNETELYRNVFQLSAIKSTSAATSTKSNATTAGKRKRGRPAANKCADAALLEKQPPAKRQCIEKHSSANIEDVAHPTTSLPTNSTTVLSAVPPISTPDSGSTTTAPLAPPPPKRKAKRNELDKLNDDIAQMYYANDVMRATGRRTCTTQQHSLAEQDSSRSSSRSRGNRSRSSSIGNMSNQNNAELAPYIRNVARCGHPFAVGRGLDRASHKARQQQIIQTKRCQVRVARCAALQRMLSVELETDNETMRSSACLVKNVNPEWHSMSSALTNCVICAASIKNPFNHYVQHHGEHYGARLPTGALQDLRAGINNRPIYRTESSSYNFKCPFCQKQLEIKNSSWVEHFARHTGEFNMQCSICKVPRYRVIEGNKHAANCGPGGQLLITQTYDRRMPVRIHVCHLCDFIQMSRLNLERHMMLHHGLQKQSITSLGQELLLYRIDGVPLVRSKTAANKLLRRQKAMDKSKLDRKTDKKKESSKKTNPKLNIKLTNMKNLTKTEPLERPDATDKPEQQTENNEVEMEQVEISSVGGSIGMPPTLPEEEQLLVINECKFERFDEEERQAHQQETVPQTVADVQLDSEPESETESMPKLEVLPVEETGQVDLSLSETEKETQNLQETPTEQQKEKEMELVTETEKDLQTEQEVEIETETESISEPRPKKSKSIFRNFQKFCNKLKSGSSPTSNSSLSNGSSKGTGKPSNKSPARGVSDSEANDLDSLNDVPLATPHQPPMDAAKPSTPMLFMMGVQNVAYRLRSTPALKPAYYCRFPGCLFLFSNELEGLENHFKSEHPLARWNGSCIECKLCSKEVPEELSIKEELRHMVETHMDKSLAPTIAPPITVAPAAEPVLPKLRVRRFTGDRLAAESETVQPETAQAEAPQTVVQLVTEPQLPPLLGGINENTMLKDLLAARPRPPSQQQLDLNAAGVGEFLCAKTAPLSSVSVSVPEAAPSSGVINQTSELGLAINQVFSLADASIPARITPVTETVTLPVVRNDDFVLTQSLTQNVDGQTPAEIHISIEPRPESPAPVAPSGFARLDQRTHLIADRFRCMASNCNYCAHTVMCIREHMKFHCFGFGSKDYLRCAYCSHVGKDINDYVRHGVIDHGLANRFELEEPRTASSEISERIRDVLNQRTGSSTVNSPTASTVASILYPTAGSEPDSALTSQSDGDEPISMVIAELLKHTGYDDNKLYACPIKGCSVCLTEENFGNHILYHMSSNAGGNLLSCKYCRQTFERPAMLKSHLQQMHGRHKYFCSICLETTVNPRLMLQHMHSRHKEEFQRMNFLQHFVELTAYHRTSSQTPKNWVSAVEQPFGQKKMEEFLGRLIDELRQRRNGTKNTFRTSELRVLSRMTVLQKSLQCAECPFKTQEIKALQQHLMTHKLELVRLAYPAEDHTADAQYQQQLAAQELVSFMEGEDMVISTQLVSSNELVDPKREQIFVPGKQLLIAPKIGYVPKELRFVCGVNGCGLHLGTEQALRQHLSTTHMYSEGFTCVHCQYRDNLPSIDRILEHLSNHKRHVYQCGACPTILPKRYSIDRHIYERHSPQDVDIIIHKRSDQSIHSKNTEARWFKSVGPVRTMGDDWFCNLCLLVLKTETLMIMHMELAHKRNYQYCCSYCPSGAKDAISIVHHIRRQHPGKRIQPMQTYLRIKSKNRQNLGFCCNSCDEASNSYQKISKHCHVNHQNRYQFKCCHCDFGHAGERTVIAHMLNDHVGLPGLAVQQFERLPNEFLDNDFWNLAKPFTTITLQKATATISSISATTSAVSNSSNNNNTSKVFEPIDLVSSSDEEVDVEDDVNGVAHSQKLYEFACSHCTEISNDIEELKSKHWAHKHPEQPFYFCVQPQMCCPQCHIVKGNAKSLLEDHLPNVHGITNLVACDIRQLRECAFCEYEYNGCVDLSNHMVSEAHLANDLKNLTDEELNALLQLGNKKTKNEYYQCELCRVIMPTQKAIGQHGTVEHCNAPERFCFRLVQDEIIYHCSFCMYASTTEMETLRHMLDHYKKFCQCHSCEAVLSDGFEEYIQHCYTHHREDVKRFQVVHPYRDLKKFLMQVLYQFQNGLIISKSSLRNTRYSYERLMIQLHTELMRKSQQPPIPRLLISHLMNRNPSVTVNNTAQRPPRITSRRKTLNPNDLQAIEVPTTMRNSLPTNVRATNVNWHTSFTGRAAPVVTTTLTSITTPVAVTPVAPVAPLTPLQQLPILQRIQKRRSTYVEPGQLASASSFACNGSLDPKRRRPQ